MKTPIQTNVWHRVRGKAGYFAIKSLGISTGHHEDFAHFRALIHVKESPQIKQFFGIRLDQAVALISSLSQPSLECTFEAKVARDRGMIQVNSRLSEDEVHITYTLLGTRSRPASKGQLCGSYGRFAEMSG